jgi:hypothetical protein
MTNYNERLKEIKNTYESRILKILNNMKSELEKSGFTTDEPGDISVEQYQYEMMVQTSKEPVSITFQIDESIEYDGTEDGLNFSIMVVGDGGLILGQVSPYNYTPEVWVNIDDKEGIEKRFKILERVDPHSIVDLLNEYVGDTEE